MDNRSPIALLDSGLGGLTVWKEVVKLMPHESVIYYGDALHCPYGNKDASEVLGYVDDIVRQFIAKGVKIIVLACNTATAVAVEYLRAHYDLPFVGMEPAVKPAALNSETGTIAILATQSSLKGQLFTNTSNKYSSMVNIIAKAGDGLVELVESDQENTPQTEKLLRSYIEPMLDAGADHIVLGCTHYPFLKGTIDKIISGKKVTVIDPAAAVARRVYDLLKEKDMLASEDNESSYEFYSSKDENYNKKLKEKAFSYLNDGKTIG